MFASLYSLMTAMFVLILLGFFLRRKGIIPDTGKKFLSDLVLDVVMPATIIKSFLMEIQPDFVRKMVLILAIAASIQVLALILAHLLWRWVPEREMQIYQYGTVVSNAGFLGAWQYGLAVQLRLSGSSKNRHVDGGHFLLPVQAIQ